MRNKLLFLLALITILSYQQLKAQNNQINFWVHTEKIVAEYPKVNGVINIDNSYYLYGPIREGGSIPIILSDSFPNAQFTLYSIDTTVNLSMTAFYDKNKGGIISDSSFIKQNPVVLPINRKVALNTLQRFTIRFSFKAADGTIYDCSLDPKLRATQPTK